MSWIVQGQWEFKHKRDAERCLTDLRNMVFQGCAQVRLSDVPRKDGHESTD